MSKSIKIAEPVLDGLRALQRPRETISETIQRLLFMYELLLKVEPIIKGQQSYLEWQKEQRAKEEIPD